MWKNSKKILEDISKVIPISSVYLLGSFTTKKKRPADVDFVILLETKKNRREKWSVDFMISPDNKYGKFVRNDAIKWVKEKYGLKKYFAIKLK